jgi:cupin fold WbuC family metalloprotein
MKINYRIENEEVLYSNSLVTSVDQAQIEHIKQLSFNNQRNRIRLCTHLDKTNSLHEMLIIHKKNTYIRPHKHIGKSESTHIIEGLVDVILFNEDSKIDRVISMGDYASGKTFYYRLAEPIFHMLIIRSDFLIFHETTNGPFECADTFFAPWAPSYSDDLGAAKFTTDVENHIKLLRTTK